MDPHDQTTILVVEDEALIRMLSADVLSDAGFRVLEAKNAAEAIAVLETAAHVELVFTDIRMPGRMDGLELATFVHAHWPAVHGSDREHPRHMAAASREDTRNRHPLARRTMPESATNLPNQEHSAPGDQQARNAIVSGAAEVNHQNAAVTGAFIKEEKKASTRDEKTTREVD